LPPPNRTFWEILMISEFDLDAEITRLLTPRQTLAPWIFEPSGIMKEDVREGLMNIVRKVVSETIYGILGLEVKDVCLTGSSSGYLYKDDSDIDIRIEVHNINCPELTDNQDPFDDFLSSQKTGFFAHGYNARFLGRFVDVKMTSEQVDFLSLYSVKNNKWLIKPNRDYAKDLTLKDIKKYYLKARTDVLNEFDAIQAKYKGALLGTKLKDFYFKVCHNEKNFKDFAVYKLLSRERILKAIREKSVFANNEEFEDLQK